MSQMSEGISNSECETRTLTSHIWQRGTVGSGSNEDYDFTEDAAGGERIEVMQQNRGIVNWGFSLAKPGEIMKVITESHITGVTSDCQNDNCVGQQLATSAAHRNIRRGGRSQYGRTVVCDLFSYLFSWVFSIFFFTFFFLSIQKNNPID